MSNYYKNDLIFWVRAGAILFETAGTLESGEPEESGLGAVLVFAGRTEGARVQVVHPRGDSQQVFHSATSEFAVPLDPEDEFAGMHYLHLPSAAAREWAERQLALDPRVSLVHRPATFEPPKRLTLAAKSAKPTQWAIDHCGFFAAAADFLKGGGSAGPIAIIDIGPGSDHPDIKAWLNHVPPVEGGPGGADHGARVASIIAARPNNTNGMTGCCPTSVDLYCVHNAGGYHPLSLYQHLDTIAARPYRVLNVSLEAEVDPSARKHFRKCADRGVITVAAMGNDGANGSPPLYPATDRNVIAVGGTDGHDGHLRESSTGPHIWMAAPAEDHTTINGATGLDTNADGTSFAAPLVSSAIWLMLSAKSTLNRSEVKDLLARSAANSPPGGHDDAVGHGRLDLRELKQLMHL